MPWFGSGPAGALLPVKMLRGIETIRGHALNRLSTLTTLLRLRPTKLSRESIFLQPENIEDMSVTWLVSNFSKKSRFLSRSQSLNMEDMLVTFDVINDLLTSKVL